jgi:hypothetical protein
MMYSNQELGDMHFIYGDNLSRPHILPDRLKGQNYKAFLKIEMPDFLITDF